MNTKPQRRVGVGIAAAVLLTTALVGGYALKRVDAQPRTQDAYLSADLIGVAAEISGRIVDLPIHENDRVAAGAPLFRIDPEPFELRVRQARAQIAALAAQIGTARRTIASQSAGADAAAAQVHRAGEQAALAQATRKRLEPLLDKGYVTAQQLDEARTNASGAQAALTAATRQAAGARQAVGDVGSLQAQLESAEAALALVERDLRNTTVVAPFAGIVSGLGTAYGEYVGAGRALFSLIKTDSWHAVANFRETELASITAGDPATLWLIGAGNARLSGHVESLGAGVRPANGSGPGLPAVGRDLNWVVVAQRFPVRIALEAPPEALMRVGATVSVKVQHVGAR